MRGEWTNGIVSAILCLLHVCSGLYFTTEPTDSIVALSRPFSWPCVAAGDQPIKYSWSFEGQILPLHGNQIIQDDGSLYLRMVTADDVGRYTCTASSGGESVQSEEATLRLAYIDPTFSTHPQTQTELLGSRLVLSCSITSLPPAEISWILNGEPVSRGTVTMADNGTSSLDLYPAMYQVAGTYKCMATNPMLGVFVYSLTGKLTVKGQPVFLSSLNPVSVPRGFTATFYCNFYADPEPEVTWYAHPTHSDGSVSSIKIVNSDKYTVHLNGTFHIYNVRDEDGTFYSCNVQNSFGTMSESALLTVTGEATAPTLQNGPSNQTVNVGGNATFVCDADGNPKPTISWKYGDGVLTSNDHVTVSGNRLVISDVKYGDTGWYWCVYENQLGSGNQSAYLHVQVTPSIDLPPKDTNILLGSLLSLQCVSSGKPEPEVTWLTPNTGVITSSNSTTRISVQADGTLTIAMVTLEDAGTYTCTVSNVVGDVQASAKVTVETVPAFTKLPVSQSVNKGDKVFLHCQASGIPGPTYSWSKDEEGAIQSTSDRQIYMNNTLVIHSVSQADAGVYHCKASNTQREVIAVATVTVTVAPSFSTTPANQTVRLGGSVQLECVSTGDPVPTQTWLRNGRIVISDDNVYVSQNHSVLTITGITEDQFGVYKCTATNMAGSSSVTAHITAEDVPVFTTRPSNATVNQSEPLSLPCNGQARETPSTKWFRETAGETTEIPSQERVTVTEAGELILKSSISTDEGWYVCVISNSAGNQTVRVFINVQVPPDIHHTNSPQTTVSLSSVTLTCQSSGDPAPSLQWLNPSEKLINASPSYVMTDNSLEIISANHTTDDGTWTCKACNMIGCDLAFIDLQIEGMPIIQHFHGNRVGDIITLKCSASSIPTPSVTFTSQGQTVTSAMEGHTVTGDTLSVTGKQAKREYTCRAGNKYGVATQTVKVPLKLEAPVVTNIDSRWVTLQWTEPSSQSSLPVIGYQIQVTSDLGVTWQNVDLKGQNVVTLDRLNVSDLLPYTQYRFRVAGVNILGVGEFSGMSTMVRTLSAAPSSPTSLIALEIGGDVVMLSWKAPLRLNGHKEDIVYHYTVEKVDRDVGSVHTQGTVLPNETLQADIQNMTEPFLYEVYVRAANVLLNQSSIPATMSIDLTVSQPGKPDSRSKDSLSPDKLIAIVFGALGGVVMVVVIVFLVVHIRHQRKSKSLSFVSPHLSLDQFYMENPKNLYNDKPRSMKKSRSGQGFYKFNNDDSFHGNGSFIKSQGDTLDKRCERDTDVLLVAKNPLYTETDVMNVETRCNGRSRSDPAVTVDLLRSTNEGVQEEIELPQSRIRGDLTPLSLASPSGSSDRWKAGSVDSETGSVCFAGKEPLTPLSAENLEDDILMIYSSINPSVPAQPSSEPDQSLEHVYSSIHSDGQRSRTSSVPMSLSSNSEDNKSAGPKPPVRVLSRDKLRVSQSNSVDRDHSREHRSASPTAMYTFDGSNSPGMPKLKSMSPTVSLKSGNSVSPKPPIKVTSVDKLRGTSADKPTIPETITASVHPNTCYDSKSECSDDDERSGSELPFTLCMKVVQDIECISAGQDVDASKQVSDNGVSEVNVEPDMDCDDTEQDLNVSASSDPSDVDVAEEVDNGLHGGNDSIVRPICDVKVDNRLHGVNDSSVVRPIRDVKVEDNYLTDDEIRLQTQTAGLY